MKENKKLEKNLKYSVMEGTANSVMVGFGESYLSPFAIALGASNMQVGLLRSLPQFLGSVSQLFSSKLVEMMGSRKSVITISVLIQALMWIPIIFVLVFPYNGIWALIFFVSIYWIIGSIISPIWNSMIGDIVPDKIKAIYFGQRNKLIGLSSLLSVLTAGILLQIFTNFNLIYGFVIIFSVALFARVASWNYFRKLDEPQLIITEESKFSFVDFIKRMRHTNYGIFVIYLSLLAFSVQIASPYFTVYMLRDLQFDYLTFIIVVSSSSVARLLAMTLWGKESDRFGNKRVIAITGILVSLIPLLWLFSTNPIYLVLVQIVAGFCWAGFDLSSFNFMFDTVSSPKRVRAFSYYNTLSGFSSLVGATLGGVLLNYGTMFIYQFYFVLIISGVLRFLSGVVFLPRIREVKEVEKISGRKLLWYMLTNEILGQLTYPMIVFRKKMKFPKRTIEKLFDEVVKMWNKLFEEKGE